MDTVQAKSLYSQLAPKNTPRLPSSVAMDKGVRDLLGGRAILNYVAPRADAVVGAFEKDEITWDPALKKLIRTESALTIDESVRPKDVSPEFENSVEQCMEFVERYFRTEMAKSGRKTGSFGEDWPSQHNIADEVRAMASGAKPVEGYSAYLNGQGLPPRAGDVLSLESAADQGTPASEFHVTVKGGKWTLQRVMTSQRGYSTDMDIVGWIHPTGKKALPGTTADGRLWVGPSVGRVFGVA